ncbi:nucleoid-associated protein [Alphaproteobacteria bacterium]|nr:nucleoid-associated protein [Alphaproteobacteria bacterium]
MNNMQQLLNKAQKLQAQISKTQAELETKEVSGSSGSGMVSVTMTLKGVLKAISIDKSVVNPEEVDILEDLVFAAFNDAKQKADKMFEDGMKEATGGLALSPGLSL